MMKFTFVHNRYQWREIFCLDFFIVKRKTISGPYIKKKRERKFREEKFLLSLTASKRNACYVKLKDNKKVSQNIGYLYKIYTTHNKSFKTNQ